MKKIWVIISLVLGIIFISQSSTTVEASRSFEIENYDIVADVKKNGDVELTQKINYQFDGDFHGVYYNQNLKGITSVTTPKVYVDTGYSVIPLKESSSGKNNSFKITKTKKNLGIKVYHDNESSGETFIYKYRLKGLVTNYEDTAEINWRAIDNWESDLHDVKVTVNLPAKQITQLQAWTHGPLIGHNKVDRKNGRVIASADEVSEGNKVETHMIFPTTITATNPKVVNKKMKAKIIKHEKQLAIAANKKRQRQDWIYWGLMLLGLLIVIVVYFVKFRDMKKKQVQKHIIPTPLYHLFDEPKFLPSFTKVILEKESKSDSQALTADLMYEVGKRKMKIEKVDSTYEITALTTPTNPFFKYLIDVVGDGKKVSMDSIRNAAKEFDDEKKVEDNFDTWAENAAKGREKYLDLNNMDIMKGFQIAAISADIIFFIMFVITMLFAKSVLLIGIVLGLLSLGVWGVYWMLSKRITSYTDLGEEEVNKIRAFRRMLEDIDDIKMAEVGDIVLWEQFIPYAVAFGVADKVVKAMQVNFSAKELEQAVIVPYYFTMSGFFGSTSTGFQSSFIGALGAGGSSSISGGSGGFSGGSSGGFGGGSGGAF